MSDSPEAHAEGRPARFKLHGTVLALVQLENGRTVRARMHQLSTGGGILQLDHPIDRPIKVELMFQMGKTAVRNKAEMMMPIWATKGCLQPFRFTDLDDQQRSQLESHLETLLGQPPRRGLDS